MTVSIFVHCSHSNKDASTYENCRFSSAGPGGRTAGLSPEPGLPRNGDSLGTRELHDGQGRGPTGNVPKSMPEWQWKPSFHVQPGKAWRMCSWHPEPAKGRQSGPERQLRRRRLGGSQGGHPGWWHLGGGRNCSTELRRSRLLGRGSHLDIFVSHGHITALYLLTEWKKSLWPKLVTSLSWFLERTELLRVSKVEAYITGPRRLPPSHLIVVLSVCLSVPSRPGIPNPAQRPHGGCVWGGGKCEPAGGGSRRTGVLGSRVTTDEIQFCHICVNTQLCHLPNLLFTHVQMRTKAPSS